MQRLTTHLNKATEQLNLVSLGVKCCHELCADLCVVVKQGWYDKIHLSSFEFIWQHGSEPQKTPCFPPWLPTPPAVSRSPPPGVNGY